MLVRPLRLALLGLALLAATPAAARDMEAEVLALINAVRADPSGYADELERYARAFDGLTVRTDDDPQGLVTQEGRVAVDDAIASLRRQRPLPPLGSSPLLSRAAVRYAQAQGAAGLTGHYGADRSTPMDRVMREGGGGYVAEAIGYGAATPDAMVRQYVVDDGVPSRGHRALLLSANYRFAGVGCAPHVVLGGECVIEFAQTKDGRPGGFGR